MKKLCTLIFTALLFTQTANAEMSLSTLELKADVAEKFENLPDDVKNLVFLDSPVFGPLIMSPEEKARFLTLPKRVQLLVIQDEQLRNKARDSALKNLDGLGTITPMHECEDENPIGNCVRNCVSRDWRGNCQSFGADFCGPGASCATNCTSRDWRGNCQSYGADVCGRDYACAASCSSRDWQGNCQSWGADDCGENYSCAVRCNSRDWQGNCQSYSADYCGTNASCVANCTSRDWQGNCQSFGADNCF